MKKTVIILSIIALMGCNHKEAKTISKYDEERLEKGSEIFHENEKISDHLFWVLKNSTLEESIFYIDSTLIPAWKAYLVIVDDLDTIKNLPDRMKEENRLLKEFANLLIESLEIMKKSLILNEMDIQDVELDKQRDEVIEKISKQKKQMESWLKN
jgi:hypothetical protein